MATVTAQQLIAAGIARADMTDAPTAFIPHPATAGTGFDAFTLLNAAISELYDILYESDESSYVSTTSTFNTVNGQANYAFATIAGATFYHLRAIDLFDGSRWFSVEAAKFDERNDYPVAARPARYLISGANVTIMPTPNAVYPMRIIFVPNPPILVADADTVDLQGPWREYIEAHIACGALDKEQTDSSAQTSKRLASENRIRNASKKRDAHAPVTPVDVQGNDWNTFGTYPGGRIY